jgi:hypothetical protein
VRGSIVRVTNFAHIWWKEDNSDTNNRLEDLFNVEDRDALIMQVRGRPVDGHSSSVKSRPAMRALFPMLWQASNNVANIVFIEPLSFFDWSEEERKIAKLRKARGIQTTFLLNYPS